jgi:beta-fructofuranosidase
VYFLPKLEKIVVERSKANAMPDCNRCDERGPFTLFTQLYAGEPEQLESLKLRLFVDKDVVEVYANERFALATMVYVRDNEALGVSLVGEGQTDSAVFENVTVWGMRSTQLGYCG